MRRIINGKKYDTDTADFIDETGNNLPQSNFRWMEEELYKKKTGEFFLAGEGGPLSKYGIRCDNNTLSGSHKITPLTIDEAKEWVENNSYYDTYVELFGEPEE